MINLNDPKFYFNRELSWLRFNTRVLAQSMKIDYPLLEQLKFLAIYATNLDEFYMIRIAGLKQLFAARVVESGADKLTPLAQLKGIRKYLHQELKTVEKNYKKIIKDLEKDSVLIKDYSKLSKELKQKANEYFIDNVFPIIIPITIGSTHPFPRLNNLSFGLAVKLKNKEKEETTHGIIRIPRVLPRFIEIEKSCFVPIESIVKANVGYIFDGFEVVHATSFRVTRNADIIIEEEEADDFIEIMEEGLRLRRKGAFVRLEIEAKASDEIVEFLNSYFKIFYKDIYRHTIPLNLGSLWQIISNKNLSSFVNEPYYQRQLPPFEKDKSIFKSMNETDSLIMHPYESFDPITKLVQESANDPEVLSLRMTLYRVEKNSPIVKYLIAAANNDKQVTVMVELKARFDEENNLAWARTLENAGAHVVYGIPGFKVHSKVLQVIKRVGNELKFYMHLGTGNYNGATSKIYSDMSFFTTKKEIAKDVTHFFHYLTGHANKPSLDTLKMSPVQIKQDLLLMIKNEEKFKEKGKIILKTNALVDESIVKALYKASMHGVKIDLIVRGICTLKPGIKGVSENITVHSLIGKYLEHARIYYFEHQTPGIFIASADLMPRNLDRRFELMTPIEDESLSTSLREILNLQLLDNFNSYILKSNGEYKKIETKKEDKDINSHKILEEYTNKVYKSFAKEKNKGRKKLL